MVPGIKRYPATTRGAGAIPKSTLSWCKDLQHTVDKVGPMWLQPAGCMAPAEDGAMVIQRSTQLRPTQ